MAADRTPYHRWCVKCFNCRVSLNPRTLNEHNEQLFCNCCYQNIFNPQEFSMYGYNGNITEEDRLRYVVTCETSDTSCSRKQGQYRGRHELDPEVA